MERTQPPADDLLVARLVALAPQAWERLLAEYGGQIEQACRRALAETGRKPDPAAVADAAAEILRALLEDDRRLLRQFRPGSRLGPYLNVIAHSRTLGALRSRTPIPWFPAGIGERADEITRLAERSERLAKAMEAIPQRDARLLRLFYLEGLSYAEAAGQTGEPAEQMGTLLARARKKLKEVLGEDFLESV